MVPESSPEHQAELEVDWEDLGESDEDDEDSDEEMELLLSGSDEDLMRSTRPTIGSRTGISQRPAFGGCCVEHNNPGIPRS